MRKSKQPSSSKTQISRSAVYRGARTLTAAAGPQPAYADSPIAGAVMTAALAAVALTGLGLVVATLESKTGSGTVTVQPSGNDDTGGGTDGDGGTTGDTGGGGDPGGSGGGDGRFEISGAGTPQDAPLAVRVDDLILSTADVTETNGHAALEFRAVQGNDVLWHWSARVEQGKTPQISHAAGTTQRIVRQDKDLLIIRGLKAPLTYKAPDANGSTTVDIIMAVDAAGARN